jgi:hypothetical protein
VLIDIVIFSLYLGLPDRTMTTLSLSLPPRGIVLKHVLAGGGLEMERCCIYRVDDSGSRQHGTIASRKDDTVGSRRRMCVDRCTQT